MKKLELALLGSPDFKLGNKTINDLVLRKGLALVAYLAVTKQTHSREALAGMFWGDMPEEKARRNLRVALTKLRPYFEDFLIIQRRTVAFDVNSDYWLDVELFEQNLHHQNPSVTQLQTAVALYRGPFLADLPLRDAPLFEDWIRPYQERLRQMAMDALYRLSVANLEQRQYSQGIDNLSKLLILEPWMEEAHRQLMLLFALSGQRTAALSQFETCQEVLDEELGVEPGDATYELYQKILNEEIEPEDNLVIPLPSPAAPPVLTPFQAPAAKPNFIGRDVLLDEICAALRTAETHTIQALVGMGGIGKSSLAVQIAHALRAYFLDGVLWANAAISDPMTILSSWAQLYGYDFSQITDLESMAAAYRSILSDKHVLIVLDDVTSITRMKPLLPGSEQCQVLLTTRDHDLARGLDAQVWFMKELSLANGRLLLASILGEERLNEEPEAATDICNLLENLPLAVEIIAQRLKSRPRRRLADVAERLRREDQRLSELQISDRAVRASFAISFQSLDVQLRRMFTLMGLFNGRSFTAETLGFIAELDRYEAEDRIFALTALSLVEEEGQSRYTQHALLADFALEKLGDEGGEEYGRFAQYYLHFAQQNQTNYDALRPEWENMMAAMQAAYDHQLWQTVLDFADTLNDAWFARGRFTQARQGFDLAVIAAETVQNNTLVGKNFLRLGVACIEQNAYQEASLYLEKALQIFQVENDVASIALIEFHLARIAIERAEYETAAALLDDSKQIREKLGDDKGLASIIFRQARLALHNGDLINMGMLGKQALALQEENQDQLGQVPTLRLLAQHSMRSGDYESAKLYAEKAIGVARELQNNGEVASAFYTLAGACRLIGDLNMAKEYAEQCLVLFTRMGDRKYLGMTYYELCLISRDQGKTQDAITYGQKGIDWLNEVNASYTLVNALINIGNIYQDDDEPWQALQMWQKALSIAEKINHAKIEDLRSLIQGIT